MITLEQIRLLEGKITRAIELIRVLKEENGTLRKGLESAQKRMRELEALVDGFKADQKEIESVIVRTLHNLDELEENAAASRKGERLADSAAPSEAAPVAAPPHPSGSASSVRASGERMEAPEGHTAKEELDIF
jgi:peptidoglycan hydrolase CwlO-like protein